MSNQHITIREAAELAGVEPRTIHDWFNRGYITRLKRGYHTFIDRDELIDYLTPRPAA